MTDLTAQVGNWTEERSTTQGTGDIVVSGTVSPEFVRIQDSMVAGEIWYSISNGYNSEAGIGIFDGVNTIQRTNIGATFEGGVYSLAAPLPINLVGPSIVSCTFNTVAFNLFTSKEDYLGLPVIDNYILASTAAGVRSWVPQIDQKTGMVIREETATTTLLLSDSDNYLSINSATPSQIIIPTNASLPFPIGTQLIIQQTGAGALSIAPTSGVTIESFSGFLLLAGQYAGATLFKKNTDTWTLMGDLQA